MPNRRIKSYLREHHIPYETIAHAPAYTAQEIAAAAHIPGKAVAKTVMLKVDGRFAMLVEPATHKVDLEVVRNALGAKRVELAHEYEFYDMFPECDTGAMPPFSALSEVDVDVLVDELLERQDEIVFNGGSHSELIRMRFEDFEKLVKPKHVRVH